MTKHTKLNLIIVLAAVVLFSVTALSACNPPPQYEGIPVIFSLEGGTYQNGEGQAVVYYDFPEGARRLIKPLQETAEKDDPPVRAGYVFEGWFKTKNNDGSVSEPWDFENDEIGEEGVTLYAGWSRAIKYTYEVYDYDTDELVATRTVNAGVRFRETYATRSGYTLLALYDGDRQPWDEDFVHPGGETDTAVKVYARYIKGDYEVVRTAEELAIAAVSNENIYVAADIDMKGAQLSFGNFTEREFLGNGYTISNFSVGYSSSKEDLIPDFENSSRTSLAISLFGNAEGAVIKDANFVNVTVEVDTDFSRIYKIYFAPLCVSATDVEISNVTVSGSVTVKDLPEEIKKDNTRLVVELADAVLYPYEATSVDGFTCQLTYKNLTEEGK